MSWNLLSSVVVYILDIYFQIFRKWSNSSLIFKNSLGKLGVDCHSRSFKETDNNSRLAVSQVSIPNELLRSTIRPNRCILPCPTILFDSYLNHETAKLFFFFCFALFFLRGREFLYRIYTLYEIRMFVSRISTPLEQNAIYIFFVVYVRWTVCVRRNFEGI